MTDSNGGVDDGSGNPWIPAARSDGLIMTESGDELLVYDEQRHHIHQLNQTSAVVWQLCDGRRTVPDLVDCATTELRCPVDEATIRLALVKLEDANLLSAPLDSHLREATQTRRGFLRRAAIAGAAGVPTVVSISTPSAAVAASGCLGANPVNCSSARAGFCCVLDDSTIGICLHIGGEDYPLLYDCMPMS